MAEECVIDAGKDGHEGECGGGLEDGLDEVFNGGGNPYGASFTSDHHTGGPDKDTLVVARAQGARLARVANVIGAARDAGLLTTKPAPSDAEIGSASRTRSLRR